VLFEQLFNGGGYLVALAGHPLKHLIEFQHGFLIGVAGNQAINVGKLEFLVVRGGMNLIAKLLKLVLKDARFGAVFQREQQ